MEHDNEACRFCELPAVNSGRCAEHTLTDDDGIAGDIVWCDPPPATEDDLFWEILGANDLLPAVGA
jgi:hypothetical protein